MIEAENYSAIMRSPPGGEWAADIVGAFGMFTTGGYIPWVHDPGALPRRRTLQAFSILSEAWMYAHPLLIARVLAGKPGV